MNNNFNSNRIGKEATDYLKNNGIDPKSINGDTANKLLSSLSKEDAEKINNLLNNKEALNKILASEQAKNVLKQFFGGGAK